MDVCSWCCQIADCISINMRLQKRRHNSWKLWYAFAIITVLKNTKVWINAYPANYKTTDHRQATDHRQPTTKQPTGPPATHRPSITNHRPTDRSSTNPPTINNRPPTHRQVFHRPTDHIRTDPQTTDFKTVLILILATITFCVCY